MTNKDDRPSLRNSFNKILNSHGYGFHYAVLSKAKELYEQHTSNWAFESAEFPVSINGAATRIDFILKKHTSSPETETPFFLVAECKRANPALADWCFVRAPFVRRNRTHEPVILEHIEIDDKATLNACGIAHSFVENAYHIALEVRTEKKGDNRSAGRGAIEEAATQVCRGLNGLVETEVKLFQIPGHVTRADFLPVIFTTAKLWTTNADLSSAELESGDIDLENYNFEQRPWIILQYHMSPGIKNYLLLKHHVDGFSDLLDMEYIRSIPIVNATAIPQFMTWVSTFDRG
jgi:hypothetical protein